MTHATRDLQSHVLSGKGINSGSHTYFLDHTRTRRASPYEGSAQAGATSETTQTWKAIHTIYAPIYSSPANMKGWLWRPNDIRGPCGPKASRHLSYRWGKTPKKPHPKNLPRSGIKPGYPAWQARMLPPAPQRWTNEWGECGEMGAIKCVVGENGRNPEKNLFPTPFRPPRTPHGVNETRIETREVRGERLTACATEPPPHCVHTFCHSSDSITFWYI